MVISWSGGVPSTTLVAGSIAGLLPRADAAIFADTGNETASTLRTIGAWLPHVERAGIEVLRVGPGTIIEDATTPGKRWASMPLFTQSNGKVGRLRRECTREYKTEPIEKALRAWLGYKPRQRIPPGSCEEWLGYTREEIGRLKPPRVRWMKHAYPWIDMGWFRFNVANWLAEYCRENNLPYPAPSACVVCPFRDNWHMLPQGEQQQAIWFDGAVRNGTQKGREAPAYLHRSCLPLAEVIKKMQENNHEPDDLQQAFAFECDSGHCGL